MNKQEKKTYDKFGSNWLYQWFRELFAVHISLLYNLREYELLWKANTVRVLLSSMCSTGSAILELSDKPEYFYCEMIMLARSFIEKGINFCYLNICNEEELEKFLLHPLYKSYSRLKQEKSAWNHRIKINYEWKVNLENQSLQRALILFPKENLNWSKKNIHEKLNEVADNTSINIPVFLMNTLMIYSNASEALHGSLYWCSFHTYAYDPWIDHTNPKKVEENSYKNLTLLLAQLGSMIHEIIKYLWGSNEIWTLVNNSEVTEKVAVKLMNNWMKR